MFEHPDICSHFIRGYVNHTFLLGNEKAMCDILQDVDKSSEVPIENQEC